MSKNKTQQTGPTTAAGKAISSQNARTHGATSQQLILPGEDRAQYEALLAGLRQQFETSNTYTAGLVETLAEKTWFAQRANHRLIDCEFTQSTAKPDMADWTEEDHRELRLRHRYDGENTRAAKRALSLLTAAYQAEILQLRLRREREKTELASVVHTREMLITQSHLKSVIELRQQEQFRENFYAESRELDKQPKHDFVFDQTITVRQRKDGGVYSVFNPPNRAVLAKIKREIERGGSIAGVARSFAFTCNIPEYYRWLDIEQPSNPEESLNWEASTWIGTEEFVELAAAEKKIHWEKALNPETLEAPDPEAEPEPQTETAAA